MEGNVHGEGWARNQSGSLRSRPRCRKTQFLVIRGFAQHVARSRRAGHAARLQLFTSNQIGTVQTDRDQERIEEPLG